MQRTIRAIGVLVAIALVATALAVPANAAASDVSLTRILGGLHAPGAGDACARRRAHHLHRRADRQDQARHLRRTARWKKLGTFLDLRCKVNDPRKSAATASVACWAWPSTRATSSTVASTSTTRAQGSGAKKGDTVIAEYRRASGGKAEPGSATHAHGHQPAGVEPQRRPPGLRARRPALHRHRRRRRQRRPPGQRPEADHAPGQAAAHRPARSRRRRAAVATARPGSNPRVGKTRHQRHLGLGPAQPVALLLRPRERQPLDRRRRPGRARGDRPRPLERAAARGAGKGKNYGWNRCEGTRRYPEHGRGAAPSATRPVHDYAHGDGRCSVTGGYVHRGPSAADLARALRRRRLLRPPVRARRRRARSSSRRRPTGASPRSARTPPGASS